jgi:hypothetical protein
MEKEFLSLRVDIHMMEIGKRITNLEMENKPFQTVPLYNVISKIINELEV